MNQTNGIMAWFARNPMAANFLMIFIVISGLLASQTIRKEFYPEYEFKQISIMVDYAGAAPQEIESGITNKVEHALNSMTGVKRITSQSGRGYAYISLELEENEDKDKMLDKVTQKVNRLVLPQGSEKPTIQLVQFEMPIMTMVVHGDASRLELRSAAHDIEHELRALSEVRNVKIKAAQAYEINLDIAPETLQAYDLSLPKLAEIIQKNSKDFSGGIIRSDGGVLSIRGPAQMHRGAQFASLPVLTLDDGTQVLLKDLVNIQDAFDEGLHYVTFQGEPSISIQISNDTDQDLLALAKQVKAYLAKKQQDLPSHLHLELASDLTEPLQSRLDLMTTNMLLGGVIIFVILAMFLQVRLAFWVMCGLPICFLGTLFVISNEPLNMTLNMVSMFGFILVLGIVVDDAIVIGDSVFEQTKRHGHTVENVILGAKRVAVPATFGVLTTIVAFVPFIYSTGPFSENGKNIGWVAVLCLIFSLIESKLILPAHLATMKPKKESTHPIALWKKRWNQRFDAWVMHVYRPFLSKTLKRPYVVLSSFLAIFILTVSLITSGVVRWVMFANVEFNTTELELHMITGTPEQHTFDSLKQVEKALYDTEKQQIKTYGESPIKSVLVEMGKNDFARIAVELKDSEERTISLKEFNKQWRANLPTLVNVKKLTIGDSRRNSSDSGLQFGLKATDTKQAEQAVAFIKEKLKKSEGVFDIYDNLSSANEEVRLALTAEGRSLGLSLQKVSQQVSDAFYGIEIQRFIRDQEEVTLRLRYPRAERKNLQQLQSMLIEVTPKQWVPLATVATITLAPSVGELFHENGKLHFSVSASVDQQLIDPLAFSSDFLERIEPELAERWPNVSLEKGAYLLEAEESLNEKMQLFLLALLMIYILMALPLKSYFQPLLIMSVIPFGFVGAILGHALLGYNFGILSVFGVIALSGVVVNDSLVMVDYVNQALARGESIKQAVLDAGCARFRAILLTSLTTSLGLLPMLLETSIQAQFLIPAAVSLAFGILFATFVTLIFIPNLYIALEDGRVFIRWCLSRMKIPLIVTR